MKKLVCLVLALCLLLCAGGAMAAEFGLLTYSIIDGSITITGCQTSASGELVIPATIEHDGTAYEVTCIGSWAFSWCTNLTSVKIPDTVESIENRAFNGCTNLTSVKIPDTVESIGSRAFNECKKLTSVKIPDTVKSIGSGAFNWCEGLTSVTIPKDVTIIEEDTFNQCTSLESVTIPDGVTSIGSNAFTNCNKLTSITIPSSVSSIGFMALAICEGLTSITIPASVTSIDEQAFKQCTGLTSVTFAGTVPPSTMGDYLFNYCENLATIRVPMGSEEAYKTRLEQQHRYFRLESGSGSELRPLLQDCTVVGYALPQTADLPQTGDHSSLALWGALLALACAGMMVARKREA